MSESTNNPNFDIPPEMRAFAEKSMEQARQAFDSFMSAAQHAVSTAENQAANARAGAREVGELAVGFAERNIISAFEFAQKMLRAKDPKDVMALHADYVKSQMSVLAEQAKQLSARSATVAKGKATSH